MEENKEYIDNVAGSDTESINTETDAEASADEGSTNLATDESDNYYPSTYVVYGMAAGVAAGAVAMALTNSRLLLSACVLIGTLIGYFIKKGDSNEQ